MVFLDPRKRLLRKLDSQPKLKGQCEEMRAYLSEPVDSIKTPAQDMGYLAVDLEMTGLDHRKDQILSIGYVPISEASVLMEQVQHNYVHHQQIQIGQSATIHGIRQSDLEQGQEIETLVDKLLSAAAGRVLVFHNATLDLGFLNTQIKRQYGFNLPVRYIDTMKVEQRRLKRSNQHLNLKLRLDDCRERYHLPRYKSHNAAIDALATAELWLAQLAHINNGKSLPLKYFL